MSISNISVSGIRCFHDLQTIPVRPITVLIGENSTGKTTALASLRLAWDMAVAGTKLSFNEEPFVLGAWDQIASYIGGRAGRLKQFELGLTVLLSDDNEMGKNAPTALISGVFEDSGGQPKLREWRIDLGLFGIKIVWGEREHPVFEIKTPSGNLKIRDFDLISDDFRFNEALRYTPIFLQNQKTLSEFGKPSGKIEDQEDLQKLSSLLAFFYRRLGERPQGFAPIRTRPQRTYDPLLEVPEPEGSHVPMMLARLKTSDENEWKRLKNSLREFGLASGLFEDVSVRRFGHENSGPFQIRVKISGPNVNIADVGYGVSQVLPIVVEAIEGQPGSLYLLQQPEVHLHPKAQAEMATWMSILATQQSKRFVIETHSDYFQDRLRIDIRDKKISNKDVALLYLHRVNGATKIVEIDIDESGNLVNAPKGFRSFFLEEERRFLGV